VQLFFAAINTFMIDPLKDVGYLELYTRHFL
jgi:hypothetical protein